MRFVKRVRRKIDHFIKNFIRDFCGHAVPYSAWNLDDPVLNNSVDKVFPLLEHYVVFLFCHCTAHEIAPAHRISGDIAYDAHYLLLVYHASIGCLQSRAQSFMQITHMFGVILACKVFGDLVHRAGPEQ